MDLLFHWVNLSVARDFFNFINAWHAGCKSHSMLMNRDLTDNAVAELDSSSFDSTIQKGVVLVDFWAPWCGPCLMQAPILQNLARRVAEQASIAKVNVDEAPELVERFGIRAIPTLILFKNGQAVNQFQGVQSESVLAKAVVAAATP